MLIFDAHLDLAMNALEWNRDLRRPIDQIRQRALLMGTMLDFGLCRATWDLIGNEFTRPASEQHESIRSHDIVW